MARRKYTHTTAKILDAVTEHYITTGEWVDAKKIAEMTELPVARVRQDARSMRSLEQRDEYRASYSRDYPMYESGGSHRVVLYAPSREYLRALVISARSGWSGPLAAEYEEGKP